MTSVNLRSFYKYYTVKFLSNQKIRLLFSKIIKNQLFENDPGLRNKFINVFFFRSNYFQSKLIFYYSRKIWPTLFLKRRNNKILDSYLNKKVKQTYNMKKFLIWRLNQLYLKNWLSYVLGDFHKKYNEIFFNLNSENCVRLKELVFLLNRLFLLKSNLDSYTFLSKFKNFERRFGIKSLFGRSMTSFYSKKRLKLFRIKHSKSDRKFKRQKFKGYNLQDKKFNLRNARKFLYLSTGFLIINLSLNNIFLTVIDYKGKTLYKCSSGFYGIKGQNKKNIGIVSLLTYKLVREIRRFNNINRLFILYKVSFTNKLIKSVFYGLKASRINIAGILYNFNHPTSFPRKKKSRRI